LKLFLKQLDCEGICHEDESNLRKNARKRSDVKTTATQYFLSDKCTDTRLTRESGIPRSCIIIPTADVPEEFFELLELKKSEGSYI